METHICKRSCSSKSIDKTQITCFGCSKSFYLHCFNVAINKVNQKCFFTADSPVQFICKSCQDAFKSRVDHTQLLHCLQGYNDTVSKRNDDFSSNINVIIDKLNSIESSNAMPPTERDKDGPLINGFLDKIDSLIEAKLSRFNASILNYRQVEEIFMKHECGKRIAFNNIENGHYTNNPLDWSMSSPKPRSANVSDNLFSMLHSFETNTWASFDSVTNLLKKNTSTLDQILANARHDIVPNDPNLSNRSPLVESIQRDEKLDSIYHGVCSLKTDFSVFVDKFEKVPTTNQRHDGQSPTFEHNGSTTSTSNITDFDGLRDRFNAILSTTIDQSPMSPASTRTQKLTHAQPATISVPVTNSTNNLIKGPITSAVTSDIPNVQDTDMKSLHLLGANVKSKILDKHFHISPFDVKVTTTSIMDYIAENAKINRKRIKIHRLTKKGQDISALRHINFNIETDDDILQLIMQPRFWPAHIIIKPWTVKNTEIVSSASFLCKN